MKSLVMGFILFASLTSLAEGPGSGQQGQNKPPRPPKEAVDACQSKNAGDACSFSGPKGDKSGTCFTPEATKPLACKPSDK